MGEDLRHSAKDGLPGYRRTWVGLLAASALAVLWVGTARSPFEREYRFAESWCGLLVGRGTVVLAAGGASLEGELKWWMPAPPSDRDLWPLPLSAAGLGFRGGVLCVGLPFWLTEIVVCAWTAPAAYRLLRKRKEWDGANCQTCGYDLRDSPERCPECGAPNPWRATPGQPPPPPFRGRLARFVETAGTLRSARRAKDARRDGTPGDG